MKGKGSSKSSEVAEKTLKQTEMQRLWDQADLKNQRPADLPEGGLD